MKLRSIIIENYNDLEDSDNFRNDLIEPSTTTILNMSFGDAVRHGQVGNLIGRCLDLISDAVDLTGKFLTGKFYSGGSLKIDKLDLTDDGINITISGFGISKQYSLNDDQRIGSLILDIDELLREKLGISNLLKNESTATEYTGLDDNDTFEITCDKCHYPIHDRFSAFMCCKCDAKVHFMCAVPGYANVDVYTSRGSATLPSGWTYISPKSHKKWDSVASHAHDEYYCPACTKKYLHL